MRKKIVILLGSLRPADGGGDALSKNSMYK